MKKIAIVMIAAAFVLTACGGADKAFRAVYDETTKELNALNETLKGAKTDKEAAAGLDKFVAIIKDAKSKTDALEQKHGFKAGEVPASLEDANKALLAASEKLSKEGLTMVMQKFSGSPLVQAAAEKMKSLK